MSTLLSFGSPIPVHTPPDPSEISVKALSLKTRNLISTLLNPPKVIPTDNGLPRDWRGLAHLVGFEIQKIPVIACDSDPTARVLTLWQKQDVPCNIQKLTDFLEELDRYDIIDDTSEFIAEDIKTYLSQPIEEPRSPSPVHDSDRQILTVDDVCRLNQGLDTQNYDAFVVFADEDIDFATELIETMEKQYGLKLCVKERDLVAGLAFEHKAIIELISERCNRLIVIISPAYLKSPANKFVVNFAQALGIEQGKRKIIPCLFEKCELPQDLKHYFMLDYSRSGKLWNFWDKLKDSIQAPPISPRQRKIGIQEVASYNAEKLPDLKPALVHENRNHIKPKKEGVKFGSLSNLTIPDTDNSRLTASTNVLYHSPEFSEKTDTDITLDRKKSNPKNWLKRLLSQKDMTKKKDNDGTKDKKKKFWLKKKIKVPVMN